MRNVYTDRGALPGDGGRRSNRRELGEAFREIAAGTTLLERRATGTIRRQRPAVSLPRCSAGSDGSPESAGPRAARHAHSARQYRGAMPARLLPGPPRSSGGPDRQPGERVRVVGAEDPLRFRAARLGELHRGRHPAAADRVVATSTWPAAPSGRSPSRSAVSGRSSRTTSQGWLVSPSQPRKRRDRFCRAGGLNASDRHPRLHIRRKDARPASSGDPDQRVDGARSPQ